VQAWDFGGQQAVQVAAVRISYCHTYILALKAVIYFY
jgi:hypothetical protein